MKSLAPVQRAGDGQGAAEVHDAAARGVAGSGGALPHLGAIQRSFGSHDVSNVQAHVGGAAREASQAIGAEAYATGNDVAFSGAPTLHTAAHEAAHVVQQQAGVSLAGGVGAHGDRYEQHADAVADAVVQGKSAEGLLDRMAGGGAASSVQRRAIQRTGPPPAPPGPVTTPGGGTPPPAPAAPPPKMTEPEAKSAIDAAATGVSDLSHEFAKTLAGTQTQDEFLAAHGDEGALKHDVIRAYLASGDAKATTQAVGKDDPVAVQKFADIDNEQHLETDVRPEFYGKLKAKMSEASFIDRTRTYDAMKAAAGYSYNFKGRPIPAERITPLSTRNQAVDGLFRNMNAATAALIDQRIANKIRDTNPAAPASVIATATADPAMRKKAYGNILKSGTDPLSTINTGAFITQGYGTWYHPGAIVPSLNPDPDVAYQDMMRLGALQPEWYPDGTVVLDIDMSGVAGRVCRKPTAFDGLMSVLWVARNMSEDDYGLTGGGAGEFLEANVPYSAVKSARAVIPSDTFQADLQAMVAAAGPNSTPTEELMRGNMGTSSDNMSSLYGGVLGSSANEQMNPGASPTLPGAAQPTSGAAPGGPAAASGGIWRP